MPTKTHHLWSADAGNFTAYLHVVWVSSLGQVFRMISSTFQKDSTAEFATIFLGFHLKFYVFGALQMSILAARFWQRSPGRAGGQWAPAVGRPTMHQVVLVHGFFSMICINCSCSHLFTSFHIFSRVNWASNFPNEIFSQRHRRHDRRFPVTQVFTVGALEIFSIVFS